MHERRKKLIGGARASVEPVGSNEEITEGSQEHTTSLYVLGRGAYIVQLSKRNSRN
jgi:hypothetical protein